jgi:hypothetical protein
MLSDETCAIHHTVDGRPDGEVVHAFWKVEAELTVIVGGCRYRTLDDSDRCIWDGRVRRAVGDRATQ